MSSNHAAAIGGRNALVCAASVLLTACVGTSQYDVHPFYDGQGRLICCEAHLTNSKDIGSVEIHVVNSASGFTLDFEEKMVSASAPIAAGGGGRIERS